MPNLPPVTPQITRNLDRPLIDVHRRTPGVLPLNTFSPEAPGRWIGGRKALTALYQNGPRQVGPRLCEKLLTVLAATPMGNDARVNAVLNGVTIRQFRERTPHQQIEFINQLWNAVTDSYAFDTAAANMYDPDYAGNVALQPLPTSWCPNPNGGHHKRVAGQPWRRFQVGFRIDGSNLQSINRVLQQGMTQQRLNSAFMRGVRGQELEGTAAYNMATARVWSGNNDIFNESAVCVSRNFFGATAFPERSTLHHGAEFTVLWAVDCSNLNGFDTENYQRQLPGNRSWRPGEKAFSSIPTGRIIGWIPVHRLGAPDEGGWRFEIRQDTNWTITGNPSVAQRTYIMEELNAWRGQHTIPGAWDFAT